MKEKYLVTSALPYANGPIHLGHVAGAYLPADVFVRFNRLKGNDVVYVCGSDEYGVPITLAAMKENAHPKDIAKKYHDNIKKSFDALGISFDNFSGTAREVHNKTTSEFFLKLLENDYISKRSAKQFYCPNDKMFLPDRYVEGICPSCGNENARGDECPQCGSWLEAKELKSPRCALCGTTPVEKDTTHWYLRLDKLQPKLEEWIAKKDWKDNVVNFVKGWFKAGLRERAITRDLSWGIPVPLEGAEGKVIYVWFDAPIGYLSSTKEWADKIGKPDRWKDYWLDKNTKLVHFIGKDNIPFHTIIWPAILMGQEDEYILPYDVPANEYLTVEGQKLSTSRGNVVWVDDAVAKYPASTIRYFLASNAPEKKDADFSFKDFQQKVNKDLCDIFGNLVNRTFTFIEKHFDGVVPERKELLDDDKAFLLQISEYTEIIGNNLSNFRVRDACSELINLARISNRYFDAKEPWHLIKTDKHACGSVLNLLCNAIRMLATYFYPIIPDKASELYNMLGFEGNVSEKGWPSSKECDVTGNKLLDVKRLFDKIDDKVIEKDIKEFEERIVKMSENKSEEKALENVITIDDFFKAQLKTARVLEAERIEKSNKLLKLQIEVGDEKRQLVAGLAKHFAPEELIGKTIIIVANLKPAKLMGVESQGMLLAAKNDEGALTLLTTEKPIKSGSSVG